MDNNQEVYNTKQKINSWLSRYFFTNSLEQNTFWIRLLEQKGESYWCVFFLFFFFTHDNKENEERRKQTSFFIREEVLNNLQSGFCSKLCCWKHGCQITNVATTFDAEEVSEPKFCFVFSTFLTFANERVYWPFGNGVPRNNWIILNNCCAARSFFFPCVFLFLKERSLKILSAVFPVLPQR